MNQDHCHIKPLTIDEYIASQEESIRPRLERLRFIIREAIPDAEERISWSMPTFWNGRDLIHFAAFKKHIGLYPGDEAIRVFAEKLSDFKVSKGTIRFPYDCDLPETLIVEIAKWCYASYSK